MSIFKPVIYDGGLQRQIQQGDVLGGAESLAALSTAGAGTLTAALLTSGIINRTGPTGAYTDTTDTAANIVSNLIANYNYQTSATAGLPGGAAVQPGTTFRLRYINTVAYAMTLAAGSGVTLVGTTTVNASSVKDYLITVTNGTPTQVFAANTTNSSAVITGLNQFQTSLLSVGQAVTGAGIAASSVIVSIQPGVGVTLNNNATATGSLIALTFSPTVSITGLGQGLL